MAKYELPTVTVDIPAKIHQEDSHTVRCGCSDTAKTAKVRMWCTDSKSDLWTGQCGNCGTHFRGTRKEAK